VDAANMTFRRVITEMAERSDVYQKALELHKAHRGKIEVGYKVPLKCAEDLSLAYTPGVAEPCRQIHSDPSKVWEVTSRWNLVAVVSDGSAVLGLGDIGALASLPVMEGKCNLFKKFANVDAFPILVATKDVEKIIETVRLISPTFGGINLEDIAAPRCFEIERKLQEQVDIPIFHDDQHGTAVIVLGGLQNALKVVGKTMDDVRIVINGAGAAGTAIAKICLSAGAKNVVVCDSKGIISRNRTDLNWAKKELAEITNPEGLSGDLAAALKGADVFLGVSVAGAVTKDMVRSMKKGAVIFAMANPVPEIFPDEAKEAGAVVVATGRSDFPNQINNCLGFPGIFRGALDAGAMKITEGMKLAAANALSGLVSERELKADYIIPSAFDERVVPAVAKAVAEAARAEGVCRW